MTDIIPAGDTRPPANIAGPPAIPAGQGSTRPVAGPGTAVVAATSWLDELVREMRQLDRELSWLFEQLEVLAKTAASLDSTIANVDQLGQIVEAPVATIAATDADSMVSRMIVDLVNSAGGQVGTARSFNAAGLDGLRAMQVIQDKQTIIGAGPKLLASAHSAHTYGN